MPTNSVKSEINVKNNTDFFMKTDKKINSTKYKIIYKYVALMLYVHLAALYGIYLCFTSTKLSSLFFNYFYGVVGGIGVTAGAHRLWAHKAYKAKMPLQFILMLMQSISGQNSATYWIMEHRLHHKYTDTDADPYNASKGFFFSHIGWLMVRKHPEILKKKDSIDMSDIYSNPILRFQKTYSWLFIGTMSFVVPTLISMYVFDESLSSAWHITMWRYVVSLHSTFLVNSAAHIWGYKPYNTSISSTENIFVAILAIGEGFHNYHHVFPWDYKAAELGNNYLNPTTWFINFFAKIGWAHDLKSVSEKVIQKRQKRTGDGTNIWNWDDTNFATSDKSKVLIFHPKKM